ncbi:DNA polymerase [Arboricoccus pini]|uniref:Type-4 uracil-DNA glycosylase n=1 Tax=Arboricoccus pini TaxID=1963835 RepID=A0A212PYD4_9PROT|nr:uracil-DNA glycosylase [Arboricoccus pini]SNB51974.1 DNA polymerase [Arboricoccus pini]
MPPALTEGFASVDSLQGLVGLLVADPLDPTSFQTTAGFAAWLEWQAIAGVDDCLLDPHVPLRPAPAPVRPAAPVLASAAIEEARDRAARARDLDELGHLLAEFDGCGLKSTASHLCYAIGTPRARLMIVGDTPTTEDDLEGRPFAGDVGLLLTRMLASIGLSPENVWATNTVFWRPPGNRPASAVEIEICRPFVERQIELLSPDLILTLGGPATRALLAAEGGESRLRGRAYRYGTGGLDIAARATFHPATLLREPLKKRLAWRDLQEVARLLSHRQEGMQKTSPRHARPLPRPSHDTEPEGGPTLS